MDGLSLAAVVASARYKPGWSFRLLSGLNHSSGGACQPRPPQVTAGTSGYAVTLTGQPRTLIVCAAVDDSSEPHGRIMVEHVFGVPPDQPGCGWVRWLLDRILDIERHEACEWLEVAGARRFYPEHGPGAALYAIRDRAATSR